MKYFHFRIRKGTETEEIKVLAKNYHDAEKIADERFFVLEYLGWSEVDFNEIESK